jgi:hypothetical protein
MKYQEAADDFDAAVRVNQILVLSLAAGVCAFASFALITEGQALVVPVANFSLLTLAVALAAVIARLIAPALVVAQARHRLASALPAESPADGPGRSSSLEAELLRIFQSRTTLAASILEAGALVNVFAFWTERQWIHLAVVGALLAAIVFPFPSREAVRRWLERQRRLIEEARMLHGRAGTDE